jgi:hypothetical protein
MLTRKGKGTVPCPRSEFKEEDLPQDVEKSLQLCSHIAQKLNVPQRVRFASSLAAAALKGSFEHPGVYAFSTAY